MDNRTRSDSARDGTWMGTADTRDSPYGVCVCVCVCSCAPARQADSHASVSVFVCVFTSCGVRHDARMLTMMFARRAGVSPPLERVECVSNVARFCQPNRQRPRVRRRGRRRRRMRIHVLDSALGHVLPVLPQPVLRNVCVTIMFGRPVICLYKKRSVFSVCSQ